MRFVALLFALVMTTVDAQTLGSTEAARKLTDDVLNTIIAGNIKAGFALLKPHVTSERVADFETGLDTIVAQISTIERQFGKTIGKEFLREKALGESLYEVVQLQKFEQHAAYWRFIFYRPRDGKWVLSNFNMSTQIEALFN